LNGDITDDTRKITRNRQPGRCSVEARVDGVSLAGRRQEPEARLGSRQVTVRRRATNALTNVGLAPRLARGRPGTKGDRGVFGGADGIALPHAGATCADPCSALAYVRWVIVANINREMMRVLDREVASSPSTLVPVRLRIAPGTNTTYV
jgi:hypothetical protein